MDAIKALNGKLFSIPATVTQLAIGDGGGGKHEGCQVLFATTLCGSTVVEVYSSSVGSPFARVAAALCSV